MSEEIISRGERTRAEILLAAHNLFLVKGYHGTSMRQIAQAAGVALGGIYNHFSSKDEIFKTVLLERHPYTEVLPLMNSAQGLTVEEFVRDAARLMVGGLGKRMDFLNLMFIELVEFNGQHIPQLFNLIFPQVLTFAQHFFDGREELRPIPTLVVVRAFIGLFFSFYVTDLLIAEQMPNEMRESALDTFVDIYLHGILKEGQSALPEVK